MTLPLHTLLPLRALTITLRFTESASPRFFHQAALTAFLRFLAGSPSDYDKLIRIDAPESGCVHYRAGDHYRFVLIGLAGSDALLDHLLARLAQLPDSAPRGGEARDHKVPFRDNLRLVSVQDFFNERDIHSLHDACVFELDDLQQEAALWANAKTSPVTFRWQWLSPARLLKAKAARKNLKNDAQFVRDADDISASLLLERLYSTVATLIREREQLNRLPPAVLPDTLHISHAHTFWLDAGYTDANGKHKTMGGAAGVLALHSTQPLPDDWWQLLILGQYLGVGQRTTFGWGRYTLLNADGAHSYRTVFALNSLLMLAKDEDNLMQAWRHVVSGRDVPNEWLDNESEDAYACWQEDDDGVSDTDAPLERLQTDLDKMLFGQYKAPALRGHLIPKNNGGIRPLAIPPLYDRVLQRAVQQVLTPAFEQLMYTHSYGYRPGKSRISASEAIQKAWRDGYQWVYEGDVRDFFDSVQWQTLRERLEAFYFNDPVVDMILHWMAASVHWKDAMLERSQGLPQGSPLSPLMANLILDDFDRDMQQQGFHLIRFADDFVVLCKNPQTAKKAQTAAQKSLQEHGLDVHPDKERLAGMDDGFRYLGYLFVKDMALDISGQARSGQPSAPKPEKTAPQHSWMAELGRREAEHAHSAKRLSAIVDKLHQQQAILCGEREKTGTLLTVTGCPAVVSTLNNQVHVHRDDKTLHRMPWRQLQAVLLLGYHQVTTQAMHAALAANVPIHLASSNGYYKGCITHNRNSQHQAVWMQQILAFQDKEKALYCAREIVVARLRHMKEVLRQRQQAHKLSTIDHALKHAANADSLSQLLGYEGSATREYYQRIAALLPTAFGFQGRNRRPPRDPFNVLLSLGYTQVYALAESLIQTSGLLPWQGFYHQARGQHAVLASDLMEPFRHLVERTALTLVLRGEITEADFSYTEQRACRIDDKARRKFIALLMDQWSLKVKARGATEPESWTEHLRQQVLSLKAFVTQGEPFHAFKLR